MKIRRTHAAWAVKLWVLGSVFLIPFLDAWQIAIWLAVGSAFGLAWRALPEEPEAPVEPLPYQHLYKDREIPRRDR